YRLFWRVFKFQKEPAAVNGFDARSVETINGAAGDKIRNETTDTVKTFQSIKAVSAGGYDNRKAVRQTFCYHSGIARRRYGVPLARYNQRRHIRADERRVVLRNIASRPFGACFSLLPQSVITKKRILAIALANPRLDPW